MNNANLLFFSKVPVDENFGFYSLKWMGHIEEDTTFDVYDAFINSKNLFELKKVYREKVKKFTATPLNVVLAD